MWPQKKKDYQFFWPHVDSDFAKIKYCDKVFIPFYFHIVVQFCTKKTLLQTQHLAPFCDGVR
jgi:hypothetical protein